MTRSSSSILENLSNQYAAMKIILLLEFSFPSVRSSPFLTCITHACIIDICFIRIGTLCIMDTYVCVSRIIHTLCIMDASHTHYASYTHYASWTHHTHTMHHGHIIHTLCIMDTSAWVTHHTPYIIACANKHHGWSLYQYHK